jgi:flavin reductase (DIM6/NTAB) family NADH-FMN oxidoreductase RutF
VSTRDLRDLRDLEVPGGVTLVRRKRIGYHPGVRLTQEESCMQIKVDYEVAAARRYPEQVVIALAKDSAGRIDPITISWTMTASRKPPMIAIAVAPQRYFLEAARASQAFVVCLPSTDMTMEARFFGTRSGRELDKLSECPIRTQPAHQIDGVISRDAIANFECRLESETPVGDHVVLIGRVVESHMNETQSLRRLFNLKTGYVLGSVEGTRC